MNAFFVFSGQGAQKVGMGADFAAAYPEAEKIFRASDELLGYELSKIIFEGPESTLLETKHCQTALYTVSCAALTVFRELHPEIKPVACAGLSLGEYGALYAAGAFDFKSGLKLLARRAELMDECCRKTTGTMASVINGDPEIIREICSRCGVDVANYNCPGQIVISGERTLVENAVTQMKAAGIKKVIMLNVAGAFHSRLMSAAVDGLRETLREQTLQMPAIPVFHNYAPCPAGSVEELKQNLANQVAGSVHWEECVRKMAAMGGDTLIEFGPGNVLAKLCSRTLPEIKTYSINSTAALDEFSN